MKNPEQAYCLLKICRIHFSHFTDVRQEPSFNLIELLYKRICSSVVEVATV